MSVPPRPIFSLPNLGRSNAKSWQCRFPKSVHAGPSLPAKPHPHTASPHPVTCIQVPGVRLIFLTPAWSWQPLLKTLALYRLQEVQTPQHGIESPLTGSQHLLQPTTTHPQTSTSFEYQITADVLVSLQSPDLLTSLLLLKPLPPTENVAFCIHICLEKILFCCKKNK